MQKKCRRQKLTDRLVARLRCEPGRKQTAVWDDPAGRHGVRGLHLICYASGCKVWHVRVPAPGSRSRYRVVRLGDVGELNAEQARQQALATVADARLGRPITPARGMTVAHAADRFLKAYRTRGKGRKIESDPEWKKNLGRLTTPHGARLLSTLTTANLQTIVDDLPRATVFLNPPFSQPLVRRFVEKFIAEVDAQRSSAGIILLNASTDTEWFHMLGERFPVCFTRGRRSFVRADGRTATQNRVGQALFYAGRRVDLFERVFAPIGLVKR